MMGEEGCIKNEIVGQSLQRYERIMIHPWTAYLRVSASADSLPAALMYLR